MSYDDHDQLRALALFLEEETPSSTVAGIVAGALSRAERTPVGLLRTLAARLQAAPAVAERIATRAVAAGSQRGRGYVLRRIGAVAAAAVTLSIGALGVGAIANQAAPGDPLYGIDRAYEAAGHVLGSGAPHTEERLTEALTLIDKGRSADAVALVDEAVKDYSVQNGLTDLEKAYAAARSTSVVVTPTTAPEVAVPAVPPTTIVAAQEESDPVVALRLAVEMLLRNVQATEAEPAVAAAALTDSALQAAVAASAIEEPVAAVAATTPTTSETAVTTTTTTANTITLPVDVPTTVVGDTTTTTEATTTLTMPDETTTTLPGETTTTTEPEGTSTTTTTPDGSSTTTTAPDDGSGGIILPPLP